MKIQIWFPFIFIVIFSAICAAQNTQIDSLLVVIETAKDDTSKVNTYLALCSNLYGTAPTEAVRYGFEAKELAEKLNFQKGLGYAFKSIGMGYYFQGSYIEALVYWEQSLNTFESIDFKLGVANMLNNLGAVNFNEGDGAKAIEYYLESLRVAEEIGDTLRIATALVNIGAVYYNKEATKDQALEYYLKALPLTEELGDQEAIGTVAVNMGEIYLERDKDTAALFYFEKALEAYEKTESVKISYALNDIGKVYANRGDFEQAIDNQRYAINLAEFLGAKLEMTQAFLGLANTYEQQGDIRSAIATFKHAQSIAEEIGVDYELKDAYEGLSLIYAKISDYDSAYFYRTLYGEIKETLYNAEMDKRIQSLTLGFDIEKKQGQIDLLTKDKALQEVIIQQQRFAKNAFFVGFVLILIIAFIIFRSYRTKVKTNRILDKQKVEIETLLLNILPAEVAKELQKYGLATPRYYESVSILFTDFKGFSKIAEGLTPHALVTELNEYFMAFDNIIEKHKLEKIKTIGDAYMCAGGIPTENDTHPLNTVQAGLEMQEYMHMMNKRRKERGQIQWDLRVGIHTGPIVAGVVGRKKYAYDIWGNSVNISSRMESNGEAGKLNISATTYDLVKEKFVCHYRGKIMAKNIGEIDMYFVESEINDVKHVVIKD